MGQMASIVEKLNENLEERWTPLPHNKQSYANRRSSPEQAGAVARNDQQTAAADPLLVSKVANVRASGKIISLHIPQLYSISARQSGQDCPSCG